MGGNFLLPAKKVAAIPNPAFRQLPKPPNLPYSFALCEKICYNEKNTAERMDLDEFLSGCRHSDALQPFPGRKPKHRLDYGPAGRQQGAKLILLPELFEHWYFCQEKNYDLYSYATSLEENQAVQALRPLAKELGVVLPVSFYEKDGLSLYNTVAVIDADGSILGVYRKTHIPDDHFYQEKFYFTPGNTGFQVWDTAVGRIGVGICWDQWFPEAARCMR